ncbi:hypothetical protein [Mycolicibacterium sp. CBMA 361]|uniref:hypothetical protein n=1 Tax=Mycolicibacterium sp. CBMA 361 TaxID=2606610 RepID=UPI0012DD6E07|nr:hypothetical protein [Mycolicibacterium sp. CBMA 361]MUM34536.1 hypothetical protein [Mycolicibacterium sp. CBMA 361]
MRVIKTEPNDTVGLIEGYVCAEDCEGRDVVWRARSGEINRTEDADRLTGIKLSKDCKGPRPRNRPGCGRPHDASQIARIGCWHGRWGVTADKSRGQPTLQRQFHLFPEFRSELTADARLRELL